MRRTVRIGCLYERQSFFAVQTGMPALVSFGVQPRM